VEDNIQLKIIYLIVTIVILTSSLWAAPYPAHLLALLLLDPSLRTDGKKLDQKSPRVPLMTAESQGVLLKKFLGIYKNRLFVPTYLYMYLWPSFNRKPPNQSPTNFVQTSTPTRRRFYHNFDPANPTPWLRSTQTPKPKQITGEKTLLYKKCIKFFPGSAGPRLASLLIIIRSLNFP